MSSTRHGSLPDRTNASEASRQQRDQRARDERNPRDPRSPPLEDVQNTAQYSIFPRGNTQPRPGDSLVDHFVRFTQRDFAAIARFTRANPEVLDSDRSFNYLEAAASATNRGNENLSDRYIDRWAILTVCRSYRARTQPLDFLVLMEQGPLGSRHSNSTQDTAQEAEDAYQKVLENIRGKVDERARTRQSQSLGSGQPTTGARRAVVYETTQTDRSRHTAVASARPAVARASSPEPRKDPARRSNNSISSGDYEGEQSEPEGTMTPRPGLTLRDDRFTVFQPRQWDKVFKEGTVIKIRTLTDQHSSIASPSMVETDSGERIKIYIRRMVVVRPKDGFCLAIPISESHIISLQLVCVPSQCHI
jgi:hypothetical protein